MEAETALRWLRDVKGQLYCNRRHPSGRRAWVAVVRTPAQGTHRARLIIALGSTMEEAAAAAEDQWQQVFAGLSHSH